MRKFLRIHMVIGFILFIYFPLTIEAQEDPDSSELETFRTLSLLSIQDLMNILVTSASKQDESILEAPSILSVYPIERINDYGWTSIDAVLYKIPGFFQSHDFERRTVGARGLFESWNSNHLLMLIDGVPFNDNQYGSAYTWEITPLYFLKSLEVLRGPGSALYGSNATNGVVSINTLSAEDLGKKTRARFRIGNYNSRIVDIITGTTGKHFSSLFSYTGYKTDGFEYDSYDDSFQQGRDKDVPRKYKVQDSRSGHYFFAKIESLDFLKGLVLQYHYQQWQFETGHGWNWLIPSIPEYMVEHRNIFLLKYNPDTDSDIQQEYVIRWQEHNIILDMQPAPPEVWDNIYPQGVTEYLNTTTRDIFGRIQFIYSLNKKDASLIGGLETNIFLYNDDEEDHYSNIVLDQDAGDQIWTPNKNNEILPQQGWYEWIDEKPVTTIAGYIQYSSGKIFNESLKVVGGIRYDSHFFNFTGIDKINDPEESKSFSQLSPRLGIILFPDSTIAIKALYGRAFRTPAPSEIFGANTWVLASAIRTIKPEIITTFETALDYRISDNLNIRLNGFYTIFENQAAYGQGTINNITNIYTSENIGLEAEVVWEFKDFSGFANYSFVTRVDEKIAESQKEYISKSDQLTWAPKYMLNFGVLYKKESVSISAQLSYQGEVLRRDSDFNIPEYSILRPTTVEGWISVDTKVAYNISPGLGLNLNIKNLFNQDRYIIKPFTYPFDYKMEGRQILAGLSIKL